MDLLFESGRINTLDLPNRIVRSATWEGMADEDGSVTPALIELYSTLARGGAGLLITGHSFVHPDGRHSPRQIGSHSDEMISGLASLAGAVHNHGGRIALQLNYGGAYLSRSRLARMTPGDLNHVAHCFGLAAKRALQAGFDAVQILAAHGFFLSQFLCPRYNHRTDKFGGTIENRARIILNTVNAIREQVGTDFPLLVKLNSSDFIDDGLRLEESVKVLKWLEKAGVDAVEISGGLLNQPNLLKKRNHQEDPEVFFEQAARAFRKKVSIPLILVGGIRSFQTANRLIDDGQVDYIALCRPFIREPDLARRWMVGDRQDATCISCNQCVEQLKKGRGLQCLPIKPEEAVTFFPQKTENVSASPPFPSGTYYQVSFGLEDWGGNYLPVTRVCMMNGNKSLSQGLSFPGKVNDCRRIFQLIEDVLSP